MENEKASVTAHTHREKINFVLLIAGCLTSELGKSIFRFALSLYVLDITGSASMFSLILSFSFFPEIIINTLGGRIVDRSNKKKIMICADFSSGIFIFIFLFIFMQYPRNSYLLVIYVIIIGIAQSFFVLSLNASIARFVGENYIGRTNSAIQGITSIIRIAGPVISAGLYKALGITAIFIINGITFLLSGGIEVFLNYDSGSEALPAKETFLADMKKTFSYLKQEKIISFFICAAVAANFIYLPVIILLLPYLNYEILKISGFQLSLMEAALAIGTILAALYLSLLKQTRFLLRWIFTLLLIQAFLIILWIFPAIPLFSGFTAWHVTIIFTFLLVAVGFANTIQNIPVFTYFQHYIPENMRGRIFGMMNTFFLISIPAGLWLFGIALEKIYWVIIVISSGAFLCILSMIAGRIGIFRNFITGLDKK